MADLFLLEFGNVIFNLAYLTGPVVFAGLVHMVIVKLNTAAFLAQPIHTKYFGANKTWRGIIAMVLLSILGTHLTVIVAELLQKNPTHDMRNMSLIWLGVWLGLAYVAAELPNSYWKRKLKIPEGTRPEKNKFLFSLVDQADSVIGCSLVYLYFMNISFFMLILLILFGTGLHMILNVTLFIIGVRKEPL